MVTQLMEPRVLAIDIRARKFGFVMLEGAATLLDCGIHSHPSRISEVLVRKVAQLSKLFGLSLILARHSAVVHRRKRIEIAKTIDALKRHAHERSITLHITTTDSVRKYFVKIGRVNKHEVGQLVANRFPALAWRSPKKRKPWQREPRVQTLLDAAALAVMHFAQQTGSQESASV